MTHRTARVSAIIIFLDAVLFLQEAIDSVFAQEYDDWELLLVDDGSTDGSTTLARACAAQHPDRVRYLEHPEHENLGMSAARNLGVQHARGEYIAFLDADDVWLPTKLRTQVTLFDVYPRAAMVYGPTTYWYDWSGKRADRWRRRLSKMGVHTDRLIEPPALIPVFLLRRGHTPATCSAMLRRDAVLAVAAFEERFTGMFEDQVFFYKLCLRYPVYVHAVSLDLYRQHEHSACATARRAEEYDPFAGNRAEGRFLGWLKEYLRSESIADPVLTSALDRATWPYRHPRLDAIRGRLRSMLRL